MSTPIPDPSPQLIEALNACRMRTGPCGVSFEPIQNGCCSDNAICTELRALGIRPVGRFYNLSHCVVEHFKQFGLNTDRAMDLGASKWA